MLAKLGIAHKGSLETLLRIHYYEIKWVQLLNTPLVREGSSLPELQREIVLLLGTLGGRVNSNLITPDIPEISWSKETVLNVSLPLGTSLLDISVGK